MALARGARSRPQGDRLRRLRARLAVLDSLAMGDAPPLRWGFGTPALDDALPPDTLLAQRLHEVVPAAHDDAVAATGFAAALLARLRQAGLARRRQGGNDEGGRGGDGGRGEVLWCRPRLALRELGGLHGPGLAAFGLDPARLIEVRARRDRDVLWAMEEGLKSGALVAVLGEVAKLDLTASRRLTLAAQAGGITPLLLRPAGDPGASAAWTRWRIAAHASAPAAGDRRAPGRPCWRVELTRARAGAPPQSWVMEWHNETHRFLVAAELADRALVPGAGR